MKGRALAMASWYTKASLVYCVFFTLHQKTRTEFKIF